MSEMKNVQGYKVNQQRGGNILRRLLFAFLLIAGLIAAGVFLVVPMLFEKKLDEAMLQMPEGIELAYEDADLSVIGRRANLKDVDLTLEEAQINIQAAEWSFDELQPSSNEDMPVVMGGMQMRDVDVMPLDSGESFHINEVIVRDMGDLLIQVGESNASGEEMGIPSSLDLELVGIELTADAMELTPSQIEDLSDFGYELPLLANIVVKYNYSESDQDFRLDTLTFATDDMFAFDFNMHMGGINPETIAALQDEELEDPMFLLSLLSQELKLYDMNFTYTDDSFMDNVLELGAEEEGMTVDELKEEFALVVDEFVAEETNELAIEAAEAVRYFIMKGDEITIGINPETPVTADKVFALTMSAGFGEPITGNLTDIFNLTITSR